MQISYTRAMPQGWSYLQRSICRQCGFRFTTHFQLMRHVNTKHRD